MNESNARKVLLIKAIEEGDPTGKILSKADRLVATQKAQIPELLISEGKPEHRPLNQKEESFLVKRAELLLKILRDFHPRLGIGLNDIKWKEWSIPLLFIITFFCGFMANEFESGKRLNLLAFPILVMLIWSFIVYGFILFARIQSGFKDKIKEMSNGPIVYALSALRDRFVKRKSTPSSDLLSIFNNCFHKFSHEWIQLSASTYRSNAAWVMNICAVLFAIGVIGSMYLRGLETEYYAGWESTFLNPEIVHKFLSVVLGPAALISGKEFPTLERIQSIHWENGNVGENAAVWIHLFAITTFVFIILPRCFLAFGAFKREIRLRVHFPIPYADDTYFQNLLMNRPGQKEHVCVVPYALELSGTKMEVLRSLLVQTLGWKTDIEFQKTIPYGEEDRFLSQLAECTQNTNKYLIVLFNLSSIPENEIHGSFIRRLEDKDASRLIFKQFMIVIDESHFESRFSHQANSDERLAFRKELWNRTVAGDNTRPIFINLHNPDTDSWQADICEALTSLEKKK